MKYGIRYISFYRYTFSAGTTFSHGINIYILNIYIRDSRLNRPESVSLASLARQLGLCSFQHKWASERQLYLFVLLHHVIMK